MANPALVSKLPPFTLLDEPDLAFSPSDATKVDVHPLRGLLNFGPYSKGSFGGYTSRIRIATVGPESAFRQRGDLMASLRIAHRASDRSEYVPEYPGFEPLFHVALEAAPAEAHIKWPDHLPQLPGDGDPQARLYLALEAALRRLDSVRDTFDVDSMLWWPPGVSFGAENEPLQRHVAVKMIVLGPNWTPGGHHNIESTPNVSPKSYLVRTVAVRQRTVTVRDRTAVCVSRIFK